MVCFLTSFKCILYEILNVFKGYLYAPVKHFAAIQLNLPGLFSTLETINYVNDSFSDSDHHLCLLVFIAGLKSVFPETVMSLVTQSVVHGDWIS